MTDYLTETEAATFCRVSRNTFRAHVRPQVPVYKVGRKPLFKPADLDAYLTDHSYTPPIAKRRRARVRSVVKSNPELSKLAEELGSHAG